MTKDNPYQTEEGWLNVELIISEVKKFGFIVGNRDIGKTYGFLNHSINKGFLNILDRFSLQSIEELENMPSFVDSEYQFFFLRRTLTQARAAAKRLILDDFLEDFKAALAPTILEGFETYIDFEGSSEGVRDILFVFKDKMNKKNRKRIRIGYISAISAAEKIRGPGMPYVKLIILDEFQAKKLWNYLPDEPVELEDIYDSIARNRAGTEDCKLFALGNSGSILNPYFAYYDYDEFNEVKTEKKNGSIIFYHLENEAKRNQLYKDSISGTAYGDYAQRNQYPDNDNFNVLKLKHAKSPRQLLYNIKLDNIVLGVWKDGENHLLISRLIDRDKRTFVDKIPSGSEILDLQIFYIITTQLKNKQIYFDAPDLRLIVEKYMRKYMFKDLSKINGWEVF